jgi:glycosyltransferase involved in cell wall biosynthesis
MTTNDEANTKLRIMLVTTSLMVGGAERQVFLLAQEFAGMGHAVEVVSMRQPMAFVQELTDAGVGVTSLGFTRGKPSISGMMRLVRRVRQWRPDVVHSHMIHANLLARASRLLAPVPVSISTVHSLTEGARWRELAYRATDGLATLSTNVCQAGAQRYQRVGAAPAGRMIALPNGIDVDAFRFSSQRRVRLREELELGDRFAWLAVGRLEEPKDLPTMLRAFAELPPGRRVLLLAGEGPLREEAEGLVHTLGIAPDAVRFLGQRSDIADLMSAADAYLMSSAWEGLPLVLIEASAAKLPIVTTDVGGTAEVVEEGINGFLVPAGKPVELAAAMLRMEGQDRERLSTMGEAGLALAHERYEIGAVAARWIRLYRELKAYGRAA